MKLSLAASILAAATIRAKAQDVSIQGKSGKGKIPYVKPGTPEQTVDGTFYLQASSTVSQINDAIGVATLIEMDSLDTLDGGILLEPFTTEVIVPEDGNYFALAAPQVGGLSMSEPQIADYFSVINGEDVGNSNVRYGNEGEHKDVIITQGVYGGLAFFDIFEIKGSGVNSVTQVISQPGEPLVPSIIFSMFSLSTNAYTQLSSSSTQVNGPLGTGVPITYSNLDALSGFDFTPGSSQIGIETTGVYFALAAPQTGALDESQRFIADYYMRLNGENIGNSNVRYEGEGSHKDVIITQGVLPLAAGDTLEVIGSGINAITELIQPPGEPDVPSIIFSLFEITSANYAQLSSADTQVNGPLGSGVAITFSTIDILNGIGFDMASPTEIVVPETGAYFVVAAPQIGGTGPGEQVADYWVKVNGVDVGNSGVRYQNQGINKDVIITQGVLELVAGDVLEVYGSGINSQTEFIAEAGEPEVPSIIFSIFQI